ncbi:fibrocystin [Engystomops pustulosus]|uniref:fibrocystin n=1 Tax=Engystomops pustulosus TaxID=76066 RepID=UPI003AFA0DA8
MKDLQKFPLKPALIYMQLLFALADGMSYTAYPLVGSTAGGTLITILFNDSAMDNQQLACYGKGPYIEVHMTSPPKPPVICDLLLTYTPAIQCRTRPVREHEDPYELQVLLDGKPVRQTTVITYKYSAAETPEIHDISPSSGVPGGAIELSGRIMTSIYEDYDFHAEFIEGPIKMTSDQDGWISVCTLVDKISGSIYPIHVKDDIGRLCCKAEGSYIGSQNITLSVFNKGKSIVSKDAWSISAKQELFLYQTFPEVRSIYPNVGGIGGGTDITIRGDFFMDPVTVTISGNPCKIRSVSPQVIICTTAPPGPRLSPIYPGNRGLLYEMWVGSQATTQERSVVLSASSPPDISLAPGQSFRARLSGFFVSPETNNFTFWIQSDNIAQLFISQSQDPEDKVEIASIPHGITTWTDHWELDWDVEWKQKSPKIELIGGKKYYIEMLQHGAGPDASMKIGVQLHNTWLTPEVVNSYQREKHQIVAQSSWVPDVQNLTFRGLGEVQFCWGNTSGKAIYTNSTTEQIHAAIEDMLSVHCDSDLSPEDIFLHNGFEEGMNMTNTQGERSSWAEPYCGRHSVFMPKYIMKSYQAMQGSFDLNIYHYVCFAYKGYLRDYFLVSLMYNDRFLEPVTKNVTCRWKFDESNRETWNYTCANLWTCVEDSLVDAHEKSAINVDQILLLQAEGEETRWYFMDEIIISNRSIKVYQVDPKPALPGGHHLISTTVTGSYPFFSLSAMVANCGINLPLIELCGASTESTGDHRHVQVVTTGGGEDIILEVTRLQAASPPIGGTFSVHLSGIVIPGIPVHVSPNHLRDLLIRNADHVTRPYINVTDFTINKDVNMCHKIVWTLTWKNMTGDLPNFLQVYAENLTGLQPSVTTRVVYDGGVFIRPIFGDMLCTANLLPQVIVHVNDIPAKCTDSCSYQHLLIVTPIVTDIQYTADVGCDFIVEILGSGFNGTSLDIKINQTDCHVTGSNSSHVVCCIDPFLPLGEHQVFLNVKPQGFAINRKGSDTSLHVVPKLSSIFPSVIPQTGGQLVTLTGVRFDGAAAVAFGSELCPLHATTSTTIICIAPPQASPEWNIRISLAQQWFSFPERIRFDSSLNPVIFSISPNTSSAADNQVVFIHLSNFDTTLHMTIEVTIGAAPARITNVTSGGIEATLPPLPAGVYNVSVIMNGVSLTANGFQPIIRYVLETYGSEPCCGSFLGGTVINIYGKGFSQNTSIISISVGHEPCALLKTTDEMITCQTPPYRLDDLDLMNITVPLIVFITNMTHKEIITDSHIIDDGNLTFTYHRDFTPTISNLSCSTENGSLWLILPEDISRDSIFLFENAKSRVEYEISYNNLQNSDFAISLDHFRVGKYIIKIYQENLGFANITSEKMFELEPIVSSLSPREGPSCGGTILNLSGSFFKISNSSIYVQLSQDYECILLSVSKDTVSCVLQVSGNVSLLIPIYINVSVIVNGIPGLCERNCSLTLVPEQTSIIKYILPRLQRLTYVLDIFGERLNKNLHIVVDKSQRCYVVSWNETLFTCQLEVLISPGTHIVSFPFAGDGHSCLSLKPFKFSIKPQVISLNPQYFGVNGGGSLTIEGSGLQGLNFTLVFLGKAHHCRITSANNTVVKCIVPPENGTMTITIQVDGDSYNGGNVYLAESYTPMVHCVLQNGLTLRFEVSEISSIDNVDLTVGNYRCTNISGNSTWIQCSIPQLPAGVYKIKFLDGQRGWARSNITVTFPLKVTSLKNNIDCMEEYRTLHIFGTGFSPGNTSVTICGSPCEVSDDRTTATDIYCSNWKFNSSWSFLCDLMFEAGARCHEKHNTFIRCDVTVRAGDLLVTRSLAYLHVCHCSREYDARLVPADNGAAHVAHFTGLFISPKVEEDEVLIYNGSCSVTMATEAEMECEAPNQPITAQITAIRKNWLQNTQEGNISFHFCSVWSRNSSWPSGSPPLDGDNVTVERGRTLLLDEDTPILNLLHIKGGKLLFIRSGFVHLRAHYILITDGGELEVGTSSQPFKGKVNITLYGSSYSAPIFPYGVKFLTVRDASISIHGWVPNFISTHLAYPARANDTELTLMDPVDWRIGDQFVLCRASYYSPMKQEEVLTIVNISGAHISVSPSLRYSYDILGQPVQDKNISFRPVVALLSRDITIQGNLTDEYTRHYQRCREAGVSDIAQCPYERSEKILGSQDLGMVFIAHALKDEPSFVQISGVHFLHAGQAYAQSALHITGRRPMFGSYIRGCVLQDSCARGIRLSGISHFSVEENIFYNIKGHGVIVGEHLENNIQIKRNLLIRILGSDGLSNIEALAPSAIYIRSPSNSIEENTVCGSGYGYFYHLSPDAPSQAPLGTFWRNTAMSCMRSGFRLHPHYGPSIRSPPTAFQDFTALYSGGGAQVTKCSNVSFEDFKVFSCREFGINISESSGNPEVSGSLLLGHFDVEEGSCMISGIVTPKRFQALITNTTFINFDRQECSAIRTCSGCAIGQGGFTVKTQNLKFLNSPRKVFFPYPHCSLIKDLDGSVSEQEGSHLLVDTGILPSSSCWAVDYISGGSSGRVCEADITFHRMSIALEQAPSVHYNISIRNGRKQTSNVNYVPDTLSNLYGWQALLLDKETYTIIFHTPFVKTILKYSATFDDFVAGSFLHIQHIHLPSVLDISISCGWRIGNRLQAIPVPTEGQACDWVYDSETGVLSYLVTGEGQVKVEVTAEEISIRPTTEPSPLPHPVLRWSSPESWAGVGEGWGGHSSTIPQAGDDVIILPSRTIVVDISLPPLRGLYVVGALEFPPEASNELSVACILIAGGRLSVGTSEGPLQRERRLQILLRTSSGVHCDRLDGLHVSPGVIGVYGKLQIYSAYPSKSWTRLGADIAPGNEMIALKTTVDWRPGDELVISSSSYEPHQAESFRVRNVYGSIMRIWDKVKYWHSGTSHSIGDTWRIPLMAEVGLLSRNIQIVADTPCSGRIMVGQYTNHLGDEYLGSLEVSNVEISHFGSPLFPSINFNNTSQSSLILSSSIHHSCGGGVRATNSRNISLQANVLYDIVGHGIELDGGNHILTDNLLILMRQPKTQVQWVAGVKISPPSQAFLSGNLVAGSERIGYHVNGQNCYSEDRSWLQNIAHSSLHGVQIYWIDDLKNCTKISGFLSYKNYDYGLFFNVKGSAVVDNVALVDNRVGLLPIISQGSVYPYNSLKQHISIHNSIIVGTSQVFDCLRDRIDPSTVNVTLRDRAPSSPYKGRVGIVWPTFTSRSRQWPDYPWHELGNDGAISGIMKLQDVTFSGFKKNCYSNDIDTCIVSYPGNMAITCPITAERIKTSDVRPDHIFYFHPPERATECPLSSGCSKAEAALFKDLDGSFLGIAPPVTVIPKLDLDVVNPCYNVGIYKKDNLCSYTSESQAYVCQKIDHSVVILEVISNVTEPISPILSVTDNFIQVFVSEHNPQNHCCDKTFYSILPAEKISKVCFNGLTPKAMRLRLNGGQNSTKLILALFYDVPNSFYIVWRGMKYSTIAYDSEPKFQSSDQVSSFFSFRDNLLYILLQGDEPVEIWTNLSIHLFFYVALGTGKDLQDQLPLHLATFLRIAPSQVKVVQNLQGTAETLEAMMDNQSKRKQHCPKVYEERLRVKRHSEPPLQVKQNIFRKEDQLEVLIVEILDLVTPGDPTTAAPLTYGNLENLTTVIIGALQTGELEKAVPMHVDSLMVIEPTPPTNNSSGRSRNSVYKRPHRIHIAVQPVGGTAGAPLPVQPKVIFLDIKGSRIVNLGHFSNPWKVSVYLKDSSGAPLKGSTTLVIEDGWGNFSNLAVSSSGSNWRLIFNVTSPAGVTLSVQSKEFQVSNPMNHDKENIFMLVVLSSAASAIVLFLFVCFFFKRKKIDKLKEKPGKKLKR